MKKAMVFALALVCLLGLFGCGSQAPNAMVPTVQIDGIHYLTTGVQSAATEQKDGFDGTITSTVKGSECPVEDDQSNFGVGFGYQFGAAEGTVELYIDGSWWIYATEEVRDQVQQPEHYMTLEAPPALTVTVGEEKAEAKKGSMDWNSVTEGNSDSLTSANSAQGAEGNIPRLPLDGLTAELYWEVTPDKVFVRCWNETDTESEFVAVKTGNEAGDAYLLQLQDGSYNYEVLAQWENAQTYNGECYYRFDVEK